MKTRREFLRSAGAVAAGAALTGLSGKLFLGGRGKPPNEHVCITDGYCRSCGQLPQCILPQAQSARRIQEPKS